MQNVLENCIIKTGRIFIQILILNSFFFLIFFFYAFMLTGKISHQSFKLNLKMDETKKIEL